MKAYFTIDCERDIRTSGYKGIINGIPCLLEILTKHNVKATFFVTGEVIKNYPKIVKKIADEGHEVGLHGYSHKRFDSMNLEEKENEIKHSVEAYKKLFKQTPRGFRAPQHSIDSETIKILEKYGLRYDSSVCSWNLMLLRHLFRKDSKKIEIIKNFFGKSKIYKIGKFAEVPRSSPGLALGGFELKVYPKWLILLILNMHRLFGIPINFVMHSWDMVNIKGSRTSEHCNSNKFEKRLEWLIEKIKERNKFTRIEAAI